MPEIRRVGSGGKCVESPGKGPSVVECLLGGAAVADEANLTAHGKAVKHQKLRYRTRCFLMSAISAVSSARTLAISAASAVSDLAWVMPPAPA